MSEPVWLTIRLAGVTTLVLLVTGAPLAWWLARGRSTLRTLVEAVVALPIVLPPTVLGFYLLVMLGPAGPIGRIWEGWGGDRLVFSFTGLVVGSVLYSAPFVIQPLQNSFRSVDQRLLDTAATLGAGWLDRFRSVVLPLSRGGIVTATTLGFAHTVGEFGVVLMIGGSIPGRTRVLSIALYDHVEAHQYADAHRLAIGMLLFSFLSLVAVYAVARHMEARR